MKKRMLWGGAAAVLIVYLLISWRLGFAIEKQSNEQLQQLKTRAPYVEIVANTFRRGLFRSEQDLTLGLFRNFAAAPGVPSPFIAPIQIKFHNVIWHGPICGVTCIGLARVRTQVSFSNPLQEYLQSAFGSAEPLHIESRMGFGGGGTGAVSSPAIKESVLSNGARLTWGGFELSSEFAADYNSYSLHGSAPKFAYATTDGDRVEIDDIDVKARAKRALRSLFEGDSNLAIGRISFAAAKAGAAVLSDLRGSYVTAVNDGYMTMNYKTSVGPITAASLSFSGAHFDFALNHLEMESLEQLSAAVRMVNQDASLPPAQRGASLLAAIKKPGIAFLSHDPQFALSRFSIATSSGEASVSGIVTVNGMTESDFGTGADPKALIQKLNADLDVSIDDAFLNGLPNGARAAAQLQTFADQGLATHANGKFHTKIAFHEGMATFDGKSLTRPAAPAPVQPHR